MPTITLDFTDEQWERLQTLTQAMNIPPEVYVRYKVGEGMLDDLMTLPGTYSSPLQPIPGDIPTTTPFTPEAVEKSMGKLMAMMGQLKCQHCTQSLTVSDVNSGSCHHCESPIF